MSEAAIEIQGLRKRFGRHTVLDGVDLRVPRGSVFGFLGLNGAGKSTTIKILLGLLKPDGGTSHVAGVDSLKDAIEVRRRVGYMAENQTMYGWMRVDEIISWCSGFYPTWDAELAASLRDQMSLAGDAKVGSLSKGQCSKLALLLALSHRPSVVILDDPVLGLDPLARRDFLRDVIGQLQSREVTVFFSSHLLYEIEPICDHVAILDKARIAVCDTVDALRDRVRRFEFRSVETTALAQVPSVLDIRRDGDRVWATVGDCAAAREALEQLNLPVIDSAALNLDEIFEAYVAGRKEVSA